VSAVILSLPAGAYLPRANRINGWPVPDQLGTDGKRDACATDACPAPLLSTLTVHRHGSLPTRPVPWGGQGARQNPTG